MDELRNGRLMATERIVIEFTNSTAGDDAATEDILYMLQRVLPHMVDNVEVVRPKHNPQVEDVVDRLNDLSSWVETFHSEWKAFHTDRSLGEARYDDFQDGISDAIKLLEGF
jgi:hypothetical protein